METVDTSRLARRIRAWLSVVIVALFVSGLTAFPLETEVGWGVLFLALIAGPIRGIPFYLRLIDCSFGIFGAIPLWLCLKDVKELKQR